MSIEWHICKIICLYEESHSGGTIYSLGNTPIEETLKVYMCLTHCVHRDFYNRKFTECNARHSKAAWELHQDNYLK